MLIGIHIIIVIMLLVRILSRNDMIPTTRIAWFMVITILPVFGVILYCLFGEVSLGRWVNNKAQKVYAALEARASSAMGETSQRLSSIQSEYVPAFSYASSIHDFPVTLGNKAQLMPDAARARQRLVEDIDNAKSSVNILYYIWLDDETGRGVADALIRAVKRGVTCRAMVDAMGSRAMLKSGLWEKMSDAGVHTTIALPYKKLLRTLLFSRIDLRNHRKITVIDDKISYCGSQNCADLDFSPKPKYAPWIDILLRFEGPVVTQNQLLFASDWMLYHPEDVDQFNFEPNEQKGGFPALVWGDGPTMREGATPQMFATVFGLAKESLRISTPYFVPGDVVLQALCAAAYRGVDVTMIFPARNDSWVVSAASRSNYAEMLKAGIKIQEYHGGLLHSKTLVMDDKISMIGSSNMDLRSFDLNYENNILLQDEAVTKAIIQRQDEYLKTSTPVTLEDVNKWPLYLRIWNNVVATVSPIL